MQGGIEGDEARELIADGIDPNAKRAAERAALADTFKTVATEWLELQTKSLAAKTQSMLRARIDTYLNPWLAAQWRIPAARMKMGQSHIVPLAREAVAILEQLQRYRTFTLSASGRIGKPRSSPWVRNPCRI
jgi:hypothetical protein